MSGLYGNGIALTEKVLDFLWARQSITLNNIANDDTPGFKSQHVSFEDELIRKFQGVEKSPNAPSAVSKAIEGTKPDLRQLGPNPAVWMATAWTWIRSRWSWSAPPMSISIWSVPLIMKSRVCGMLQRHFRNTG